MLVHVVRIEQRRAPERGEQVFLLPLEMAEKIVRHDGWDLARVQRYMFDEGQDVARSADAIHPILTGGAGYKMTYLPVWGGGSETVTRPVKGV